MPRWSRPIAANLGTLLLEMTFCLMHGMHPHECAEPGIIAITAPTPPSSASSPPSMLTDSLESSCEAMCGASPCARISPRESRSWSQNFIPRCQSTGIYRWLRHSA
eukprot:16446441-Heterocapsa_arctica.AAC.1